MRSGPRRLAPREIDAINEVHARAAGIHLDDLVRETPALDEILGDRPGCDFSHRIAAGRGGTYRPANGVYVSREVHEWLEANPELARAGGWHLDTGADIHTAPVWLARAGQFPGAGWYLLEDRPDDGGPHLITWCGHQPPAPVMPLTEPEPEDES